MNKIPDDIPSVAELVTKGIELNNTSMNQKEKAIAIGYGEGKVSNLSMIKKGKSKLPLGKVPVFSKVLELDPVLLLASALKEKLSDDPEAWALVRSALNRTYSEREGKFLEALKNVEKRTGKTVPMNDASIAALESFIEKELLL
ncbi:hypothetical protein [Shewanella glacialipiscicola]|uniref:hypothetical protein n=1 Tax=Shewanella glacialipiscicola TaxID=614069 RepID=UPI003D79C53D